MIAILALAAATAHASDGYVVSTRLATSAGDVRPALYLDLADPPDPDLGDSEPPQPDLGEANPPIPDFENDGRVATLTLAGARSGTFAATLALAEDVVGIEQIAVRGDAVVWGEGAAERFYPPDPCVIFTARLRDGTTLDVEVTLDAIDGELGGVVGYALREGPAGFGAALRLDVEARGRDGVTVELGVSLSAGGEALALR